MWPTEDQPDYGIFVKRQVDSLRSLGVRCDVLFVEGYRGAWEYVRAASRILRLNWSGRRPSVIHGHGGETSLVVRWYWRGPVVVSYCGSDLLDVRRGRSARISTAHLRSFLLRHWSRFMTATITKSEAMEAVLPATTRGRNVVLPNGVNRTLFRPVPRDGARAQLGWSSADRIVLFAADPTEARKRYWLARRACEEAQRSSGPIRLEVASGVQPDAMPRLMAAADCLLLTSTIEGSPNVVKEAVTCGLPVISTDVGDVQRVLAGVEPSWICEARREALAAALVECFSSRRRSNGRQQATWLAEDHVAQRLVDIYGSLVANFRASEPAAGLADLSSRASPTPAAPPSAVGSRE